MRVLLLYSTVDGQTLRICRRLRHACLDASHEAVLADIENHHAFDPAHYDSVVVGASIRYGTHRPIVARYLRWNREALQARKSALFSVNAVARKPEKASPGTNPYMKKLLSEIGWRPSLVAVFAGRLDYPRYGFVDRNVIRFIMMMTDGPTDPAGVFEFTDWEKVEAFGREVAG